MARANQQYPHHARQTEADTWQKVKSHRGLGLWIKSRNSFVSGTSLEQALECQQNTTRKRQRKIAHSNTSSWPVSVENVENGFPHFAVVRTLVSKFILKIERHNASHDRANVWCNNNRRTGSRRKWSRVVSHHGLAAYIWNVCILLVWGFTKIYCQMLLSFWIWEQRWNTFLCRQASATASHG